MSAVTLRRAAALMREQANPDESPTLTLAIAAWLDQAAMDTWAHGEPCDEPCDDLLCPHTRAANVVALAYLGERDMAADLAATDAYYRTHDRTIEARE